eukprot:TRINITY_DN16724_c0_g1_i2.p1 TRINITY_DN16724_c0_g1~~TRINITY_DN16724_c0_g1_i2.p1  ORF type:complete len:739 (+),score=246.64 TRINITY_DN16724_c0_g1_i2:73-2289(+)
MRRPARAAARLGRVCRHVSDEAPGKKSRMAGIEADVARSSEEEAGAAGALRNYREHAAMWRRKGEEEYDGDTSKFNEMRTKHLMEQAEVGDLSLMRGKATPKGTELFFEKRRIGLDQPWVREIPRTGLKVSAVTQSVRRSSERQQEHEQALVACEQAAVNVFDVSLSEPQSAGTFADGLYQLTGPRDVPRSNLVVVARCGWVVFKDWLTINNVAPDFSKIPNSRELSQYGPDISRPLDPGPSHVSLMKRKSAETHTVSPHDPDSMGDSLMRRYRAYMPDQPVFELKNLSDAALLKLTGLITANKKLGHYWSGQRDVMTAQVEGIRDIGVQTVDFLVLDAVEVIHSVARDAEEFITYLTQSFEVMEELAKRNRIQYYGVDSAMFYGGAETKYFVDPRWVVEAAERAGGAENKLRLFTMPFNLTERKPLLSKMADDYPKSVFDFLKEKELGCMTYRPLSTYDADGREQRYINHRRIKDPVGFTKTYSQEFQRMLAMEAQNERLLANTVMRPAKELYHFAGSLAVAQSFLKNYYQYDDFMRVRYDALMQSCLESIHDSKDQLLMKWVNDYRKGYEGLKRLHGQNLEHRHAIADSKILEAVDRNCGEHSLGAELSQIALNAVLATNVMQTCAVSMRNSIYIDALVSRNAEVLRPVPVSVLGGLFTDPETSFALRTVPKEVELDGSAYMKEHNLDPEQEDALLEHNSKINPNAKLYGTTHVQLSDDEPLPSWAKFVDPAAKSA